MQTPYFNRLAILGLGLIGGSFALAARALGLAREIVAFDPRAEALAEASVLGVIEQGYNNATLAVEGADGVILAAPVRAILSLLPEIAPALSAGAFVMDLGSTKCDIVAAMNALPQATRAVGGHPLAGKELSGLSAAEPSLFEGATFALCATQLTDEPARRMAEQVVLSVGARPLWLDAEAHDSAVARISHLPYLLSATLARSAAPLGPSRLLAASGYRDTSRLALSDPAMMLDILVTNRASIREALADAREALTALDSLLKAGDEAGLLAWMEAAKEQR